MEVSFTMKIRGCLTSNASGKVTTLCPNLYAGAVVWCRVATPFSTAKEVANQNLVKLTKTCPMVRAQFEQLK